MSSETFLPKDRPQRWIRGWRWAEDQEHYQVWRWEEDREAEGGNPSLVENEEGRVCKHGVRGGDGEGGEGAASWARKRVEDEEGGGDGCVNMKRVQLFVHYSLGPKWIIG